LYYIAGASSVYFWEAADENWATREKSWGIIRASDGFKKAGYNALLALFPVIPPGAFSLKPSAVDSQLATAVLLKDKTLVVVIVNDLDNDKVATVSVANVKPVANNPVIFNTWTYANQDSQIKGSLKWSGTTSLYVSVKTFVDSVVVLRFNLA
jgi:hypothetical protein